MRIVILGLAVSSSWGNGHAAFWRGLIRALTELTGGGDLVLYKEWNSAQAKRAADVAMVTSHCPDADLPADWPATTRRPEAEGSSYFRHVHMGLLDEHGQPKRAVPVFHEFTPESGLCPWFHFEDHRLDDAVRGMKDLGVTYVRTGLSWADVYRPNAEARFDKQMQALEDFTVTVTPEHKGVWPQDPAEFCGTMIRRYASGQTIAPDRADAFEQADVAGTD
jgi:hypothetical protein